MLKLGVNIDHVATLREARGTTYPEVLEAARACEKAGAHGITVHLREDRRHIHDADVRALRRTIGLPLNLEMAIHPDIVAVALEVGPQEVCIVPERREELTTEGGLDAAGQEEELEPVVRALSGAGIVVSLFIDADPEQIDAASRVGASCIELHTGTFCELSGGEADCELERLIEGAERAQAGGLKVNAGHGLNLDNVQAMLRIPHLDTLNIGHSIVARAVFVGLERAVAEMLEAMGATRDHEA